MFILDFVEGKVSVKYDMNQDAFLYGFLNTLALVARIAFFSIVLKLHKEIVCNSQAEEVVAIETTIVV